MPAFKVATHIDFPSMTLLFQGAAGENRRFLFEHEVYDLLRNLGSETPPRNILLKAGTRPPDEELLALPGDRSCSRSSHPTSCTRATWAESGSSPSTPTGYAPRGAG